MTRPPRTTILLALLLLALVAGCGGDGDGGDGGGSTTGNATDAAFVNDMVPHHEGAIEMAELARKRAEHDELRGLADDIIASQKREIETLRSVGRRIGDHHGDVHMSGDEHARGMDADVDMLRDAEPFDREFINMMIPHHLGAVTMAEEQLEKGENSDLRKLAEAIIEAQNREIAQMRKWRTEWYGGGGGQDGAGHGGHER